MTTSPWARITPGTARTKLDAAIYARKLHADDCPRWDYEETNCEECDRHDREVHNARETLKRASYQ